GTWPRGRTSRRTSNRLSCIPTTSSRSRRHAMTTTTGARIEIDLTYGGVYAGTSFEFSPAVAEHFNRAAAQAQGVLPGEFAPIEPGEYCSISCPTRGLPREGFVEAYHRLH